MRRLFRELSHSPWSALFAALSVAAGLTSSLTLLGLVRATLSADPDLPNAHELFHLYGWQQRQSQFLQLSFPDFLDLRSSVAKNGQLAAFTRLPLTLKIDGEHVIVPAEAVSDNYFRILRVTATLGDLYSHPASPSDPPRVVLSYALWHARFGGDRSVLGSPVEINGVSAIVVGIAAPVFQGTLLDWGDPPQLWIDVERAPGLPWLPKLLSDREARIFLIAGRLQQGESLAAADNVLRSISLRLARDYPPDRETTVRLFRMSESRFWPAYRPKIKRIITLLGVGSTMLLLLGILNAAALVWARCLSEARTYALRVALGASRVSIFSLIWLYSLILTVPGVLVGFLALPLTQMALTSLGTPLGIPISFHIHLDWTLVAVAILAAIIIASLVATLPTWDVSRLDLGLFRSKATIAPGGRRWVRYSILALQASFSMMLLAAAGLALFTVQRLESTPLGFDLSHMSVVRFEMPEQPAAAAAAREAIHGLLTAAMSEPGIRSAALCFLAPLDPTHVDGRIAADVSPAAPPIVVNQNFVGPGYFKAIGVRLLIGNEFTTASTERQQPIILNATLAKKLFGETNPLHRFVALSPSRGSGQPTRFEVIGVAPEMKYSSLNVSGELYVYRPLALSEGMDAAIVVQSAFSPAKVNSRVEHLWKSHPGAPALIDITSMARRRDGLLAPERSVAFITIFFGVAAAFVAAAGTFSATSRFVAEHLKNLGIRLALGASPKSVRLLVLAKTLWCTMFGVVLAVLLLAIFRPHTAELLGNQVPYFLIITGTAVIQLLLVMVSGLGPAYLGSRLNPLELLRNE